DRSINLQTPFSGRRICSRAYESCRCRVARSSPGTTKSGSLATIAFLNERRGIRPSYSCSRSTALVRAIGWSEGQTASTAQPAFVKATPSRAVGYQRSVVARRMIGLVLRIKDVPELHGDAVSHLLL